MRTARDGLNVFDGPRNRGRYMSRPRRRRSIGQFFLRLVTFTVAAVALFGVWILVSSILGDDPVSLRVESMDEGGGPVAGAVIVNERGASATTDEEGVATLAFAAPHRLIVTARGYHEAQFDVEEIPRQSALTLRLQPYVLQGRIIDQRGSGIVGVAITIDGTTTMSGEFGAFEISGVEPGPVTVSKSAWLTTDTTWSGESGRVDIALQPFIVRGVRVGVAAASSGDRLTELYAMIEGTVINAFVFDTKFEDGQVFHDIDVPLAMQADAITRFYDARQVIEQAKAHGLYTITRISTFQDDYVTKLRPEWAIRDSETGDQWRTSSGHTWLDPTNRETWEYVIALGVEACRLGFDEIQYDYVRFPTDGPVTRAVYSAGAMTPESRVATIAGFLDAARTRVHAEGCALSADIFGIIASVGNDQGIGQKVEELSWVTDALSPMIYPSHYARGWLDLDNPNDHPMTVVTQALDAGMAKLEGGALMRPWLQAFSWNTQQVLTSIQAAESAGVGWMLWNSNSEYSRDWFPRASG
jgi:hypothetical protein